MGTRPVADLATEVMRDIDEPPAAPDTRRANDDRGVALVELSFVMVLLFTLLFASFLCLFSGTCCSVTLLVK